MQAVDQRVQIALRVVCMVNGVLHRLDIDIIAYDVGGQNMPLAIENQPAWRIKYLILNVFIVSPLRKIITAMRLENLPVVQPAQENQHTERDQQENEHLSMPRAL
ncbi:MAG: hypothetical protein E6I93_17355 [Chloroflexi bacterium]|nr:MAG: hypothetical protein E6I93_17355 [Chloroflexota bacterium]